MRGTRARRRPDATAALSTLAVAGTWVLSRRPAGQELDRRVSAALSRPRGRVADVVVGAATDLGSVFALAGAAGALAATRRRSAAAAVAGGGVTAWAAAQALKPVVGRPRPYQADGAHRLVAEPAGSSWPSGHPAVAAAAVAALAPALGRPARAVGAGLVGFVGASRVYAGVHYPTDVAAGVGLGVLSGRLWRLVAARRRG